MTDLRRNFGDEHARYRKIAGLTQEQAGDRMGFAVKTVQGYEQGLRTPTLAYAERADEAFGLTGTLVNLAKLCRADDSPFGSFLEHERRATQIRTYAPLLMPGLLQTAEYARAVMRAAAPDEDLDEGVRLRLERQEVFGRHRPPRLHAIVDESSLWRPVGGAAVHRAQLARMVGTPPNIVVQVLPLMAGEHPGVDGGFSIMDVEDGSVVTVDFWGHSAIMDSPVQTKRAVVTFEMLCAVALPPATSADMIRDVMEYYSDDDHELA